MPRSGVWKFISKGNKYCSFLYEISVKLPPPLIDKSDAGAGIVRQSQSIQTIQTLCYIVDPLVAAKVPITMKLDVTLRV